MTQGRGWRIQLRPGVARGADGVKIDTRRAYGVPYLCRQCDRLEVTKHIHLDLDDADSRIVSRDVAAQLARLGALETLFEVTNEVIGPPQINVRVGPTRRREFLLLEVPE